MGSKGLPCCPFLAIPKKGRWNMAGKRAKKQVYTRIRADSGHHRRILLLMALLAVAGFFPTALRLYELMVLDFDYYTDLALRNQSRVTAVAAQRGNIYDANGTVLACLSLIHI